MKLKRVTLMTVIFSFMLVTLSRTRFYGSKVIDRYTRYNYGVLKIKCKAFVLLLSFVICMIPSNALPLPEGLWQVIGPESDWDTSGDGTRTWGADPKFGTEELDIHKRTYTIKKYTKR